MDITNLEQAMIDFLSTSPLNTAPELGNIKFFDKPLLGVAPAEDELFECLKSEDAVGPHHLSPQQWLPTAKTVISYFLPFTKEVRQANRAKGLPAREWLYGRIEGELFNKALSQFIVDWFAKAGFDAISPALDNRFQVTNRRSNWSERHVAYVAGLGTLSLNCSLITKQGSAGRLGSIIVSASIEPTPRYYTEREENCSHCGACILRCPPLAITSSGKDHVVCSGYLDRVKARFDPRYGCGKCQTAVPCEDRIPKTTSLNVKNS